MTSTKTNPKNRILYICAETLKELDGYCEAAGVGRSDYIKHILTDGCAVTPESKLEVVPCGIGVSIGDGFAYVKMGGVYLEAVRAFGRSLNGYAFDEDGALDFVIRHVAYYDGQTCGGDIGAYVNMQLKICA